jgi:hypothetical protein
MFLLAQTILNLIVGYLLSEKLFVLYSRIAFVFYPLAAIVYVVTNPMIMLAMSGSSDPSAFAMSGNVFTTAVMLAFISLAIQAAFHFLVFKLIRKGRDA